MMSDIFVDGKELFKVKVYYTIDEDVDRMLVYGESEVDEEKAKEMSKVQSNEL